MENIYYSGGENIGSSLSRRKNAAKRRQRDLEQARILAANEDPGPQLIPIRTPTIVFCKNPICQARIRIIDRDVTTKDFINCHLCGQPYPLWREATQYDRRAVPKN